ncbi:MAG: D-alanyl-D-alanine carboxypeptidase family protein [Clostridia bacterium]|nr:D-alanyl-D-alanine carboxypeptidase family protein [Clostridia bacterium]
MNDQGNHGPRPVNRPAGQRQPERRQTAAGQRPQGGMRPVSGGQRPQNGAQRPAAGGMRPMSGVYDPALVEAERQRRREQQYRENLRKREARGAVAVRVALTLVMYLLLAVLFVIFFVIKLSNTNAPDTSDYRYHYGSNVEKVPYTSAIGDGGEPMVNFTRIAVMCSMTATGDNSEMRYITIDAETENVRFVVGTSIVYMNGMRERMSGDSRRIGGDLWVPMSFVNEFMTGITAEYNEKKNDISVQRIEAAGSTEDNPLYESVGYRIKNYSEIEVISEESAINAENSGNGTSTDGRPDFKTDLSAYEKYMNPEGNEYLTLVNYNFHLASDFIPKDLIDVVNTRADRAKVQLCEYAAKALEALFIEMYANGYKDVTVTSAYRSYASQKYYHNYYIDQELKNNPGWTWAQAKEKVLTYSAAPGTSEHQTGLCIDMHNLASADKSFANQEAYKWLKDNAHKFGFILRFPEGKTDITKIDFEPWHYRYVGRYHATKIYESGMCLEEYLKSLK